MLSVGLTPAVCGLCGVCPAPLGICIFIWGAAVLVVFFAVSYVLMRRRVKKYRDILDAEEEKRKNDPYR